MVAAQDPLFSVSGDFLFARLQISIQGIKSGFVLFFMACFTKSSRVDQRFSWVSSMGRLSPGAVLVSSTSIAVFHWDENKMETCGSGLVLQNLVFFGRVAVYALPFVFVLPSPSTLVWVLFLQSAFLRRFPCKLLLPAQSQPPSFLSLVFLPKRVGFLPHFLQLRVLTGFGCCSNRPGPTRYQLCSTSCCCQSQLGSRSAAAVPRLQLLFGFPPSCSSKAWAEMT